jgi:hypothetical protein
MPPLKKVPTSYARFLTKNFQDLKRGPQRLIPLETKAVWFDAATYLQALGLDPEMPTGVIDGIRIYFGSYDNNDPRPKKRGKMTLILVPTKPGSTPDDHIDILADPLADPKDLEVDFIEEFNDGQLCPPNCDGDGLLDPDHQ